MRYTLWSGGRLVGRTDLDISTITPTMLQGFVEPTPEGRQLLADATGVWRALAEVRRGCRARGERSPNDDALVLESMRRREDLAFELRNENGILFECDFIRICDLFDLDNGIADEMSQTQEEEEAEFQIGLSALSGDAREEALARRAEADAEVEAMVSDMLADQEERSAFGSGWPSSPPADPRWETMQYLLQVHLKGDEWEDC